MKGEEAGKAALGKERALPLRGKALVKEVGKAKIGRRRLSTKGEEVGKVKLGTRRLSTGREEVVGEAG